MRRKLKFIYTRDLSNGINNAIQENFINSKLVVAAVLIDKINEDIDLAINAINDGKHGIIHPQILTPAMLKETIKEFKNNQRTRYHFDNSEDNYQHIIDISTLSVAVIGALFTYILEIPILEKEVGTLLHLNPIPHLYQKTYFSLIPEHDYIIKYRLIHTNY